MDQMTSTILMLVVMFALMYFLMIRPENKRKKQAEEMRNSLKKGDTITSIGGIVGKIVTVKENTIIIEKIAFFRVLSHLGIFSLSNGVLFHFHIIHIFLRIPSALIPASMQKKRPTEIPKDISFIYCFPQSSWYTTLNIIPQIPLSVFPYMLNLRLFISILQKERACERCISNHGHFETPEYILSPKEELLSSSANIEKT